ncbi:hypothetical protein [Rhizobium sp. 768_B6_N1_8]|uniref:hypothetical protein n=1 Tax=unclassified Rhizobium TaxID=2613769 RepID=UPI003F24456C
MTDLAWAADSGQPILGLSSEVYTASAKSLTMLFVIAVVLENGFAVIFNWRVFLAYFDTKGVKTILMVLISWIVVVWFKLDVFASLLAAFTIPDSGANLTTQAAAMSNWISKLITAFVLAGGSSGIHNLMYALGFRSSRDTEVTPKPQLDEAWVSISVKRTNIQGPVQIGVVKVDTVPSGETAIPLSGTIKFRRPNPLDLLMRARDRFPANGGYIVEPNQIYLVTAVAEAPGAKASDTKTIVKMPPRYYTFSPRAVVDLSLDITGPKPASAGAVSLEAVVAPTSKPGK